MELHPPFSNGQVIHVSFRRHTIVVLTIEKIFPSPSMCESSASSITTTGILSVFKFSKNKIKIYLWRFYFAGTLRKVFTAEENKNSSRHYVLGLFAQVDEMRQMQNPNWGSPTKPIYDEFPGVQYWNMITAPMFCCLFNWFQQYQRCVSNIRLN